MKTLEQTLAKIERRYLVQVLNKCKGNVSRAIEMSGVPRTQFYRLLKHYDISIVRPVKNT